MELQFLGSGDAFGSGGRFNTCLCIRDARGAFLVDCGASSLIAMRKFGVDPNTIRAVLITHLHGDHFGGLPFFLLDARHLAKRARPLFLIGPAGFEARLKAAQEALFPGSSCTMLGFTLDYRELTPEMRCTGSGFAVTPFLAEHEAGAPCFSLRIECDGKIVSYSGDTEWTERLVLAAQGADLFICECSSYERPLKGHLDYVTLQPRLDHIGAKRVILTHMNPDMLARRLALVHETAADGTIVTL